MKDQYKTKKQLIEELEVLRNQLVKLKKAKTNRKRSEETLRESEETFKALAENANDGILITVGEGIQAYANRRAGEITGYSVAELLKSSIKDLVHPDELEKIMGKYRKRLAGEPAPPQYETIIIRKDGKSLPIELTAAKTVWQGQPADLVIIRDITERKQAENELREFKAISDNAGYGVSIVDLEGNVIYNNAAYDRMHGYTPGELIGKHLSAFHTEKQMANVNRLIEQLNREGNYVAEEVWHKRKDNSEFPTLMTGTLIKDANGTPLFMAGTAIDITDRKRAEDDLKIREDFLQKVIEQTPNAIWISDEHGTVIRMNQALRDLLEITDEEIIGKYNVLRDVQVIKQGFLPLVKSVFEEGMTVNFVIDYYTEKEKQVELAHRTHKVLQVVLSAIKNKDGKIVNAICQYRDITDRKRAEEELRESEEKYRTLFEESFDGLFITSPRGKILDMNKKGIMMFGYDTKDEILSLDLERDVYAYPPDRKRILAMVNAQGTAEYEVVVKKKNGEEMLTYCSLTAVKDEQGAITTYRGIIRDITERKRAEEALKESESRFRNIIENSKDGIIFFDGKTQKILFGNGAMAELLGCSNEDLVGRSIQSLHPSEEWASIKQEFQKHVSGELSLSSGIPVLRNDGSVFYADISSSLITLYGRTYFSAFFRDITERKKAEEALRESEEKYRDLVENINDILYATDEKGIVTYIAPTIESLSGYAPSEIIGRPFYDFVYQEDVPFVLEKFQQDVSGHTEPHEYRMVTKSGVVRWARTFSRPFFRETRAVGLRGVMTDVTDRKRAEEESEALREQLRQSQKMEAIGRLAGGIAHDFNNLLTIIKGYSQLSLIELKEDTPLKGNIEHIHTATDRAADLVRQLLAFSRRQILEMRVLDLNTTLANLHNMLRRLIGEDIDLTTVLAEDLGRVKTDLGWIEQAIMNLVVNAKDAMPKGGKLIIETANVELDEAYARVHVAVTSGRYVMIAVSDTGAGMTPEVRERLFEPFFSTKEKDKGTGLGLSTVYGIVKQSGGDIWVYSEPGKGSTFKIYLPRVYEPLEQPREKVLSDELLRGSETILLVEDEEEVRKLALRVLERQGYKVLAARDGDEALLVCEQFKDPIHLMLTDVVMPGMSGHEVAKRLEPSHPEMKVLYMSGYTDNAIVLHGVLVHGVNYIQKPFTVDALTKKVREVLEQ